MNLSEKIPRGLCRTLLVACAALVWAALAAGAQAGIDPQDELLPDLRPVPPFDLIVQEDEGIPVLGFGSSTENVGKGPLKVEGSRPDTATPTMKTDQLVQLLDGSERRYPNAGTMAFVEEIDHRHWHWLGFMRYELRRASDLEFVRPDVKSGFCVADRQAVTGFSTPRFFSDPSWCQFENPDALGHVAGMSVGWADPYAAILEGQQIELTDLPAGRYYLIHRSNPESLLRESDYSNNESASVIALSWPKRTAPLPRVKQLARCKVVGTSKNDKLRDTSQGREGICGLDGNDTIRVRKGFDDRAYGGPGDDRFIGRLGQAVIDGGSGTDSVEYRFAVDPIRIDLKLGIARSKPGTDWLRSIEDAQAGKGRDLVSGTRKKNVLKGGPGDDELQGRGGDDKLLGGPGDDTIIGGGGSDVLRGHGGDDTLVSRDRSPDIVFCGRGFDTARVDALDTVGRDCERVLFS